MKTRITLFVALLVSFAIFMGCEEEETGTGTMALSITDAPIDDTSVTGVWVSITGVQYHMQDSEWHSFEGFGEPQTYNLLALTDSISELMGTFELEAGTYTQLRFMLDAPERGQGSPSSPGCYIEFDDGSTYPLFVPSGGQTGYKAVGAFTVPSNGTVEVTADFDARRSVVETGMQERYILKPTIRLIVNNQAGSISGQVSNLPEDGSMITVYAYEDGSYSEEEAATPDSEETRFPNAVTSDMVDDSNAYHLWYLAPMKYDLVVVRTLDGEFQEVMGIVEDITVESKKNTGNPIDLSSL